MLQFVWTTRNALILLEVTVVAADLVTMGTDKISAQVRGYSKSYWRVGKKDHKAGQRVEDVVSSKLYCSKNGVFKVLKHHFIYFFDKCMQRYTKNVCVKLQATFDVSQAEIASDTLYDDSKVCFTGALHNNTGFKQFLFIHKTI